MSVQLDRISARIGEKPTSPDVLLDEVRTFIRRFCAFPDEHCLTAVTLWAAHTHMIEHFHTSPRLALLSPDPSSGKTRVLEVLDLLVREGMLSISASPPAIFRTLSQQQITLLLDEADTIWSRRGKDDNHEDLRSLLNAGYKRGATIPRCIGARHEVQKFGVFAAVALAGLGELPDTIMSRSIIVRMRRRAPHECIEPFRSRRHATEGCALRDRLQAWSEFNPDSVSSVGERVGESWPEIPAGIVDRNEEIWEPLLAVADAAGGHWPETARSACVALCKSAEDRRVSLGIRLLGDLRIVFGDDNAVGTRDLLQRLTGENPMLGDDAPWGDLRGKPLDARRLAAMLKPYGVKSCKIRIGDGTLQGYRSEDLYDPWQRYVPPVPANAEQPEQPEQTERKVESSSCRPSSAQLDAPDVPAVPDVPDKSGSESDQEPDDLEVLRI